MVESSVSGGAAESEVVLGRRERKKQEQRCRIFEAASALFREKGFEATTVEEIAERADVAKGTVFNYFARKEAFLGALAGEMLDRLWRDLGPLEEWRGSSRSKVRRLFLRMAELAEESRELSSAIVLEKLRTVSLQSEDEPGIRSYRAALEAVLEEGRRTGELKWEVEAERAAELLEAALFAALMAWLAGRRPGLELREDVLQRVDMVFFGLLQRDAREGVQEV